MIPAKHLAAAARTRAVSATKWLSSQNDHEAHARDQEQREARREAARAPGCASCNSEQHELQPDHQRAAPAVERRRCRRGCARSRRSRHHDRDHRRAPAASPVTIGLGRASAASIAFVATGNRISESPRSAGASDHQDQREGQPERALAAPGRSASIRRAPPRAGFGSRVCSAMPGYEIAPVRCCSCDVTGPLLRPRRGRATNGPERPQAPDRAHQRQVAGPSPMNPATSPSEQPAAALAASSAQNSASRAP